MFLWAASAYLITVFSGVVFMDMFSWKKRKKTYNWFVWPDTFRRKHNSWTCFFFFCSTCKFSRPQSRVWLGLGNKAHVLSRESVLTTSVPHSHWCCECLNITIKNMNACVQLLQADVELEVSYCWETAIRVVSEHYADIFNDLTSLTGFFGRAEIGAKC